MRTRQSRITSAVGLAVLALLVFLCSATAPHARAQTAFRSIFSDPSMAD